MVVAANGNAGGGAARRGVSGGGGGERAQSHQPARRLAGPSAGRRPIVVVRVVASVREPARRAATPRRVGGQKAFGVTLSRKRERERESLLSRKRVTRIYFNSWV